MSRTLFHITLLGLVVWPWSAFESAIAHPLDPALLEIRQSANATLEVLWRVPATQRTDVPLLPIFPDGCSQPSSLRVSKNERSVTQRWRMHCASGSLVGQRIGVRGLRERRTDALLRIHLTDGRLIQAVLRGDAPVVTVPDRVGPLDVLRDYLGLGFEHILTGPDHLLFVLGLVLLVRGRRRLLWTITAFTAGHSVTLSLAVLGFVHIPTSPVEALIAFSIFVVAVELVHDVKGRPLGMGRFPWAIALAFGLLHGLGFAGALAQVGLPDNEIPLALFSFNVGIELGQLSFVALVLVVRAGLGGLGIRWPRTMELIPAYAIGSLAVFWVIERVGAIF